MCVCLCVRMKQPEYQCYRTRAGSAKTLEDFEEIAAELKQLLLVRGSFTWQAAKCLFSSNFNIVWNIPGCAAYGEDSLTTMISLYF